MIRVNLLPQARDAKRAKAEGSTAWLGVVLGIVVAQALVLLFVYNAKKDELAQIQRKNTEVQTNVDSIKHEISNHGDVRAQLKELRDREEAIQKLQGARSGPTSVLLEIGKVLTPGRGPTVDRDRLEQLKRDNPSAVPNVNWDPRRLWLTKYSESDRSLKIQGLARDGEDVSEFLRRLTLSDFFQEVRLLPAQKINDTTNKMELVRFEMSAKVKY